jgi:type III secretory pathway component EscR
MNIYVEIMTIYGITFLVSMFVAAIIWGLAKLVDAMPEEAITLEVIRQKMAVRKNKRKQMMKDFRETTVEGSEDLLNYHHEHA